tara:strand:- start:450 stop:626 length:177 start_codon:yes stop_codon:yes gene_type:complete
MIQLMNKKPKEWMLVIGAAFGVMSVFAMQSYGIAWTWFILGSTIINISITLILHKIFK